MNRRNFLLGARNAISVLAIASVLKGRLPDDGMALYSDSHFEDSEYAGFGLADTKPEGPPNWWGFDEDDGELGPPLSEASIETALIDIVEQADGKSLIIKPPWRVLKHG